MTVKDNLMNNLDRLISNEGMMPKDLDKKAELDGTIEAFLSGDGPSPNIDELEKVAKILGVTVADLIEEYESPEQSSTSSIQLDS